MRKTVTIKITRHHVHTYFLVQTGHHLLKFQGSLIWMKFLVLGEGFEGFQTEILLCQCHPPLSYQSDDMILQGLL